MTIEQLKEVRHNLLKALEENTLAQREILTEAFLKEHNLKIGDFIEYKNGTENYVGQFHHIQYSQENPRYVILRLVNANGKAGARERRLYDHEMKFTKVIQKPNPTPTA